MRTRTLLHVWAVGIGSTPLLGLLLAAGSGNLGANPIEELTRTTGRWALRFLLVTLAITPLRTRLGLKWIAPCRRTFGLIAFAYASLHFLIWIGLDHFFHGEAILDDLIERPFVRAGLLAFLLLVPLAVTSTRSSIRRLGSSWRVLHRLVYVAAGLALVHYFWLVKADLRWPMTYAGLLALLGIARLRWRPRIRIKGYPQVRG